MKKIEKYYKLIRMPNGKIPLEDFIMDIPNWYEQVLPKLKRTDEYLLLEKSCYPDNTEQWTNAFSFSDGIYGLYKIIGNRICYDYTGISMPIIHKEKKAYAWEHYNELKTNK